MLKYVSTFLLLVFYGPKSSDIITPKDLNLSPTSISATGRERCSHAAPY